MNILHTADWHIGQLFYQYDRQEEHSRFLNWLVTVLCEKKIDLLLISGDIFDQVNPSAAALRLFYSFLNQCITCCPDTQVIVTAGNHDSPNRLESPIPLLASTRIHIVGQVHRNADGSINYEKMLIPVKNTEGGIAAWCLAIPYLRLGDYPIAPGISYAEGIASFYREACKYALLKQQPGQPIIAMGHLHMLHAEVTEMDVPERLIYGGVEGVPPSVFPDDLSYVALGHIHKAQKIGGAAHIRYSGSPLPMSFSEKNYRHLVWLVELENERLQQVVPLTVPLAVRLLSVPEAAQPLPVVLQALQAIPQTDIPEESRPYLEVRVLLDGPQPGLRHDIEKAVENKPVRLSKISVSYRSADTEGNTPENVLPDSELPELDPSEVFSGIYKSRYGEDPPEYLHELFRLAVTETMERAGR